MIQLGVAPNRIDLLTSIDGVDFDEAWQARVESRLDGVRVRFIGRRQLIENKRATGRMRDRAGLGSVGRRGRRMKARYAVPPFLL
ncbi:MAG: hypothetical protein HYZ57_15870 [Acidobacteria bacterium]|nr:hypothetical protein [Acidobacteriota bacterium]